MFFKSYAAFSKRIAPISKQTGQISFEHFAFLHSEPIEMVLSLLKTQNWGCFKTFLFPTSKVIISSEELTIYPCFLRNRLRKGILLESKCVIGCELSFAITVRISCNLRFQYTFSLSLCPRNVLRVISSFVKRILCILFFIGCCIRTNENVCIEINLPTPFSPPFRIWQFRQWVDHS